MSDTELTHPGVVKMLIDELEAAEADRDSYRAYVDLYHRADKSSAVLEEKLKPAKAIDILFGVGVGLGGTIMGLAPFFWEHNKDHQAVIALVVGLFLTIGAVVAKVTQR